MSFLNFLKQPLGMALFNLYTRLVHGIHFHILTADDKQSLFRFRFHIYLGEGYIKAEDHPEQEFIDQFDPLSVNVVAIKKGEIIGACRLTYHSPLGLPTFNFFNVILPHGAQRQSFVEIGRFMVQPKYRGKSRIVSIGLVLQLIRFVRKDHSIQWLVGFTFEKIRLSFNDLFPFKLCPEKPLKPEHLKARNIIPGYWTKENIHPVLGKSSDFI